MRRNKPIPAASAEPWNIDPDAPPTPTDPYTADTGSMAAIDDDGFQSVEPDEPAAQEPARSTQQFPLSHPAPGAQSPPAPHRRNPRGFLIAAGLLVVVIAVAVVGWTLVSKDTAEQPTAASTPSALPNPVPTKPVPTDADCPDATDGPVTTGRDAGGTVGGPEVIKAFEYAYYVQRSGAKAREQVAPLGKPGSAEQMQASIDRLDPATLHCVKIADRGNGLFAVELTELPPRGGDPIIYHQLIQTIDSNGRTFINSVVKDPNPDS